jgi:hypothetical protein
MVELLSSNLIFVCMGTGPVDGKSPPIIVTAMELRVILIGIPQSEELILPQTLKFDHLPFHPKNIIRTLINQTTTAFFTVSKAEYYGGYLISRSFSF